MSAPVEMTASISPIDHLCHDKTLLGDGHRAGERHDLETVAVADHALEHIDRFAEPPATERGLRHGSDEVIDGLRVRHVERPKRFEAVVMPRVSRAIEAHVSSSGCRCAGVYPIPQLETTLRGGRADRCDRNCQDVAAADRVAKARRDLSRRGARTAESPSRPCTWRRDGVGLSGERTAWCAATVGCRRLGRSDAERVPGAGRRVPGAMTLVRLD